MQLCNTTLPTLLVAEEIWNSVREATDDRQLFRNKYFYYYSLISIFEFVWSTTLWLLLQSGGNLQQQQKQLSGSVSFVESTDFYPFSVSWLSHRTDTHSLSSLVFFVSCFWRPRKDVTWYQNNKYP